MEHALILGAYGQDGIHMHKLLESKGIQVHAYGHEDCDVSDRKQVLDAITSSKPDYLFNFAARSSTDHETVWLNQRTIVDGTLNTLEALKQARPKCKAFISGSVLQLHGQPVHANSPRSAISIYAAQRNASCEIARYYRSIGLDITIGYLSHHDSPLRGLGHLAKRIAIDAIKVSKLDIPYITIKDPADCKEWNYAGDMVNAIWDLTNSAVSESVLGSGATDTIASYAGECLKRLNMDPDLIRSYFTREYSTATCTEKTIFSKHFTTSLASLAKIMMDEEKARPV